MGMRVLAQQQRASCGGMQRPRAHAGSPIAPIACKRFSGANIALAETARMRHHVVARAIVDSPDAPVVSVSVGNEQDAVYTVISVEGSR